MAEGRALFIGTYTRLGAKGIYTCRMNAETGEIEQIAVTQGIENPSFVAIDPTADHLYAVCEITDNNRQGSVSAYSINEDGTLNPLNRRSTGGPGPCHLAVDGTDSYVIAANYDGGSVCMFPIATDGSLEERCDFVQHAGCSVNTDRQREAHAHSVTIDKSNSRAYVCDLGTDRIVVYRINRRERRLQEDKVLTVSARPGQGPRHFDFHPAGEYCYVINELGSTVAVYDYDDRTGQISEKQIVSSLPDDWDGANTTADIHASPDGRFLYGSNRGHDSIAIFSISQRTGEIEPIGFEPSRGRTPRNFAITPDGRFLLAANQESGNIVTFAISRESGRLVYTGHQVNIPAPVCIRILT